MGTEAEGTVTVGGQKVKVRADFASDHVTFSGGRRGEVPYKSIEVVGTGGGVLRLRVDGAPMEFRLGNKAERIAAKIRKPPTLLGKLGVQADQRVGAVRIPPALLRELKAAVGHVATEPVGQYDLLFAGVASLEELDVLADLADHVAPGGGLWVVYPKARRDLREADVLAAGRAAGLKDVKVARVSITHTALRFMRPAADAPGPAPQL